MKGVYRGGSYTQASAVVSVRYRRGLDIKGYVHRAVGFRCEWCNKGRTV